MRVYVKKMVEGESIPGIIRNGNYYLTALGVYEDGTVSCWRRNDLSQFRESLDKRWVVTEVPTGKNLSISELGVYQVTEAQWDYDKKSYYKHILGIIKELSPDMANIYRETPRITSKWAEAHVRFADSPVDFKLRCKFGYSAMDGKSNFIFYRTGGYTFLTFIAVYEDKTFRLGTDPDREFSFDEIKEMFRSGILSTEPSESELVHIEHLGQVRLRTVTKVRTAEKLKELEEKAKRLAGEPDAHDLCIKAYHSYLEAPGDDTRETLRKAYEAVPEHERCYLGDMDTRDTDYKRILFRPEEKREV